MNDNYTNLNLKSSFYTCVKDQTMIMPSMYIKFIQIIYTIYKKGERAFGINKNRSFYILSKLLLITTHYQYGFIPSNV